MDEDAGQDKYGKGDLLTVRDVTASVKDLHAFAAKDQPAAGSGSYVPAIPEFHPHHVLQFTCIKVEHP